MRLIRTCAALLLLAACEAQPEPEEQTSSLPAPPTRADVITDTLLVEGVPQTSASRLLQSPERAALPFSTYVPEGIATSFEGAGDSVSVRFAAAFTGIADPNAYMHVRFYAPDVTVAEARQVLGGFLAARQPADAPIDGQPVEQAYETVDPPPWGEEAFSLSYRGQGNRMYFGSLVIATRRDRVFHVLTHYPAEYGDGLAPRFDRVLRHWRWDDDGEMLIR